MSHPELLLSNQICFLFHRLDRSIIAKYRPLLEAIGLTYPQYLAMLVLWEREEAGVGELCALLDLDTGTVSPLLKRLEAAGLIERRRSDKLDERVVRVRLTASGRELEERARGIPMKIASTLFESASDYAGLKSLLEDLILKLEGK